MSSGPVTAVPVDPRGVNDAYGHGCEGLSKREIFAAMAMQGLSASAAYAESPTNRVASMAVEQADALLAELERTA